MAAAFNITVTISVLLLLFPYFWSGIALLKKDKATGSKSISTKIIVFISSIFIMSAFASATLDEFWLVIALFMIIMAFYAMLFTKKGEAA